MRNRWNEKELEAFPGSLGECVYASRLLGADADLVLHGGGNTSIKTTEIDAFGEPMDVLWVKGSGWDMKTIEPGGFVAVDLAAVARLASVEEMSDIEMERELKRAQLDPSSPCPSVEAMIHAAIPDVAVQHTHADALLAIANTADGDERIRALFGDQVIVVPYARSGFKVGRAAALAHDEQRTDATIGLIVLNHGIFTFGESPREAYERMMKIVSNAEAYLAETYRAPASPPEAGSPASFDRLAMAELRKSVSETAGAPFVLNARSGEGVSAFIARPDVEKSARRGPVTPDHVLWTKYQPLFGRDVEAYADWYRSYFRANGDMVPGARMLDTAPRVIIDHELGLISAGPDVRSALIAGDIYERTIWVLDQADGIGGYVGLPERDIFDLEYWELEQAKLDLVRTTGEFTGEVAVVTGAGSGIGRACALELLDRGAAVIGMDVRESIVDMSDSDAFVGIQCDLTSLEDTSRALDEGVERFGGVDLLVASAGLFPESSPIGAHDPVAWRKAMAVNVDAFVQLLSLIHPLMLLSPKGGRVAVIGSKNVQAPGPGASAYSASKAAANQIARVAALEWAADGIRVNSVHPDAVFDTALWTDELLASRAAKYGMSIDDYKRRNLLSIEITSRDVAHVVAATLGESFRTVTGAHIPIDGGNDRVI